MTDRIVLTLPDKIAARAREIAETTGQPIEQVLIEHLNTLSAPLPALPPDQQDELDALHHLSDDALWTIAREQMPDEAQARAQSLLSKNKVGALTHEEAAELETLIERGDQLMLRKAEAAAILRKRGYPFAQKDFKPPHE